MECAWCVSFACYLTPFLLSDEAWRPIQIWVHYGRPTLCAWGPFVPIYDVHSSPRLSRTGDCSKHLHLPVGTIVWGWGGEVNEGPGEDWRWEERREEEKGGMLGEDGGREKRGGRGREERGGAVSTNFQARSDPIPLQ